MSMGIGSCDQECAVLKPRTSKASDVTHSPLEALRTSISSGQGWRRWMAQLKLREEWSILIYHFTWASTDWIQLATSLLVTVDHLSSVSLC